MEFAMFIASIIVYCWGTNRIERNKIIKEEKEKAKKGKGGV